MIKFIEHFIFWEFLPNAHFVLGMSEEMESLKKKISWLFHNSMVFNCHLHFKTQNLLAESSTRD